ncbi:GNAT family N-acetyltransferase [Inhella sp.]|uniref:GNAT family N-acetyltransferase n=1 Tax=Inhella sp. TaxID=1921806 RepID=UPI0035AF5012
MPTPTAPALLRPMREDDAEAVLSIQRQAYPPSHHESWAVLGRKRELWPDGCWVVQAAGGARGARGASDALLGYVFSHPWQRGRPVPLHGLIDALPEAPDGFHLHDLALHADARGQGLAPQLVAQALAAARAAGLKQLSLVAVQGSQGFWARQGFLPSGSGGLSSYGKDAVSMTRVLA